MKVTVLNKKTLTIIGLVAMLVLAAIINVSVKGKKAATSGELEENSPQVTSTTEVETSSNLSASQSLARYELERQTSIQNELAYLDELINNENTDTETLKAATQQKMQVLGNLNREKAIAEVLVAKGFSAVTVVCGTETLNVLVASSELDDLKVAQILDIATSETDILPENIKIIPLD